MLPEAVLLETKLTQPRVRHEHLGRPDVVRRLEAGAHGRLTLVAAPPGFGKSTVLAEWAARRSIPVAWVSLDEHDNDPATFLAYVIAALQRLVPGLANRALNVLRAPGSEVVDAVMPHLVNDLVGVEGDLALVIDDYHLITNPDVHRAVGWLIERAPPGFRIVVSTRHDPPLAVGRLRARGDLHEIRASDLRFSLSETAAFLTKTLGLTLSVGDIDRLHARTEGWPAALYLAGLSLQGRPDGARLVEEYSGSDRFIVDYLTLEVLDRQPAALRTFLLATSVLTRFSGPLCDALLDRDGSDSVLAELEAKNLLIVALDQNREWYRYHHLFGEHLRRELERTQPQVVPSLHRRAAAWYRTAGLIVDAAHHAIAAGDIDAVAELVGDHYGRFVDRGQIATVIGWLEAIPDRAVEDNWLLGSAGAIVYAHAGLFDVAEQWLALAGRAPRTARNGDGAAGRLASVAAYLRLLRGDIGGAVRMARDALSTPEATDPIWAIGPQMVLAPALAWAGGADDARRILEAVTRTGRAIGDPAVVAYALGNRAAIELDRQDEPAAVTLSRDASDLIRRADLVDHPWSAMAQIIEGRLLGRRRELAAAVEAIERGLAIGERLGAWQLIVAGSLALAEIRHQQGDGPAARRLLARVRSVVEVLPDPGDARERLDRTERALKLRSRHDRAAAGPPFWELSPREADVLRLLPSRLSQREIAGELFVSFNTVRTHVRVIFDKLGVASRAEAVARARELGLI